MEKHYASYKHKSKNSENKSSSRFQSGMSRDSGEPRTIPYYTKEEYMEIKKVLPEQIKKISRIAAEILEPTIYEKRKVRNVILDFIRTRGRKVYGGTALNAAIKVVDPTDCIYDEYNFADIEFYSPTPVVDLVDLTNLLYENGYKYPVGSEAQHEETYSIYVNFQLYCDITYVPTRIYKGIKTLEIDGVQYVHPHFILIDQLRIINQPLTAAEFRWEKTFERKYKLLKHYPLVDYHGPINFETVPADITTIMSKIKNDFMIEKESQDTCLISGFEAYNFYLRHTIMDKSKEMSRVTSEETSSKITVDDLKDWLVHVPYLELVSVTYRDTVERLYYFIKKLVPNDRKITLEEYFPLFQFTGYSVFIKYDDIPIVRVFEANGFCIPDVKTRLGYRYVSYEYLLMTLFIGKFRAYLDNNKNMYFNYNRAISNLILTFQYYLEKHNLEPINETFFTEFKISCIGSTISYIRESKLRGMERYKQGKIPFRYNPEHFFLQSKESQDKFDPSRYKFKNTSGNPIINPKNLYFKLDDEGNIIRQTETSTSYASSEEDELERIQYQELVDIMTPI